MSSGTFFRRVFCLAASLSVLLLLPTLAFSGLAPDQDREPGEKSSHTESVTIQAYVDIVPGGCPNVLSNSPMWVVEYPSITMSDGMPSATKVVKRRPVLVNVVILGSDVLDVSKLDVSSLHLSGVHPRAAHILDVSCKPPIDRETGETAGCCACIPDGYADLVLGFSKPALWDACNNPPDGAKLCLEMSGCCFDGPLLNGMDSVVFRRVEAQTVAESGTQDAAIEALEACYPNPFNPSTSFRFVVAQPTSYSVSIYNIAGMLVKEFDGYAMPGTHTVIWDGTNRSGRDVASGVYFYRVAGGGFAATRKMMLIR